MTNIEWTDDTWNPIVGCSVVSPGCTNCYAMKMAARLEAMRIEHYRGLTWPSKAGAVWTSKIARAPEHILTKPLRWKNPRKIFVNSMGDLFHESVPDEWIDCVFAVMALCPRHIFQVPSKRMGRVQRYFEKLARDDKCLDGLGRWHAEAAPHLEGVKDEQWEQALSCDVPLPNVWLGASVEDQPRADERREHLQALAAMGWTTFVSYQRTGPGGLDRLGVAILADIRGRNWTQSTSVASGLAPRREGLLRGSRHCVFLQETWSIHSHARGDAHWKTRAAIALALSKRRLRGGWCRWIQRRVPA